MKKLSSFLLLTVLASLFQISAFAQTSLTSQNDRMSWWRDARFGLFIHWGLYSVPAGEWNGKTEYGEWIRTSAQIPLKTYDKFVPQFNPVKFNAEEWVRLAKDAGMKYITITTKHHDGFCLFDTKFTDFNIMSTPFHRDIMKELASACKKEGIKLCWYHSIMDWHHPDYLPRREWETDRPTEGADFDRYVTYLKSELKELLTNYGPIGVLWFDGEWESTWNNQRGNDLLDYVRSLQPDIIVNNRVGADRQGMDGFTKTGGLQADFSTPEQEIPAKGIPGTDWETCMTMNDHWGYNKNDNNWKSSEDLIRKLTDIASKGGNFLLNVGPTSEGVFPQASITRLKEIGQWMHVNGESIYGTKASLFSNLTWGRSTYKMINEDTRLYLHVFEWPADGKLVVPGVFNPPINAYLLSDPSKQMLEVQRHESDLVVSVPQQAPDKINSVVVLELKGKPDMFEIPEIVAENPIFSDNLNVAISTSRENIEIHYTTTGEDPTLESPVYRKSFTITQTTTIKARSFRNGKPVSPLASAEFTKVSPIVSVKPLKVSPGLKYFYYEGNWDNLPDFSKLVSKKEGIVDEITLEPKIEKEHFGFVFRGFINVPETGIYTFYTESDDGSCLYIHNQLVVDNDGLHGAKMKDGIIALEKGYHQIMVSFFEATGSESLRVLFKGPGLQKDYIPGKLLYH